MLHQLMLFVHLAGVVVWVGGMVFAYFCLRPAAVQVLQPPERLPLWTGAFSRFFPLVGAAVGLILLSGFAMLLEVGMAAAPVGWHVMMALGLAMAAVFGYIMLVPWPRLRRNCEASAWPAAGAALNRIRQMVALNLVLSVLVIAAAVSAR